MENQTRDGGQMEFTTDEPISHSDEDILGRSGFARFIADAIRSQGGQQSVILALFGAWGSGKSSIKNLIFESLEASAPRVLTIDFNPWQRSSRSQIDEQFFDELSIRLGRDSNKKKLEKLNLYRRSLHRFNAVIDLPISWRSIWITSTLSAIPLISPAIVHGLLPQNGFTWLTGRFMAGVILLCLATFAILKKTGEAVLHFREAGVEIGTKSAEEIKKELAQELRKSESPILVVLDDMDRLTPKETVDVLRLIKANGDLPNLVYLILCDRDIVEMHINTELKVSGREYLEKIVQASFEIPMIDRSRVNKLLFAKLDNLLNHQQTIGALFQQDRWAPLWKAIEPLIDNVRDVKRLTSTLSFQMSAFWVEKSFEVNPVDMIVLEVIRLFEPDVYIAIRRNKDFLCATGSSTGKDHESTSDRFKSIVSSATENNRLAIRKAIEQLFPATHGDVFDDGDFRRTLRICSSECFERYFLMRIPEGQLSQAFVADLLQARGDRYSLREKLEKGISDGSIDQIKRELESHKDNLPTTDVLGFVTAVFDVGDDLAVSTPSFFATPLYWSVNYLINGILGKISSDEDRSQTLIAAVRETRGLSMAVECVTFADPSFSNRGYATLPEFEFGCAKLAALNKIEEAATSGQLQASKRLATLLHLWARWGEADSVRNFVEQMTRDPVGLSNLLKSLTETATSHAITGGGRSTNVNYVRLSTIEPLIPLNLLEERLGAFELAWMDAETRSSIESFRKAIERRNLGLPDEPGPWLWTG